MRRYKHRSGLPRPTCHPTVDPNAGTPIAGPPQHITPAEARPVEVAPDNPDGGGVSIALVHPIEFGGVRHDVITVRPPTVDDLRRVRSGYHNKFARGVALFSMVTGCSRGAILKLDPVDQAVIQDFLSRYMV